MVTAWITIVVLLVISFFATRRMSEVPTGLQNLVEVFIEFFLDLCERIAGAQRARRFFPLVMTIFLFIMVSNWVGILPGFGTAGLLVPFLRSANTDVNTTLSIALIAMVMIHFWGFSTLGIFGHLGKFINFKEGPIGFFVGILEGISEFAKIVSFTFRLFGNIFAGEVLLVAMAFLFPLIGIIPFLGLELFVGAIQAFIFAMLTLVLRSWQRPHTAARSITSLKMRST
ncbi:ATP synthase subunit a, chloroplastic [Geodia barretti]|uniref:ATP synthase subunit a, chloroplastic n=1 Tax=Geodia barretti TaxID=519541 RepID=A0AA35RBC7_GEOBA|nr:ATP synthase subunit a, chloroplastic [Geodia barretti]